MNELPRTAKFLKQPKFFNIVALNFCYKVA